MKLLANDSAKSRLLTHDSAKYSVGPGPPGVVLRIREVQSWVPVAIAAQSSTRLYDRGRAPRTAAR